MLTSVCRDNYSDWDGGCVAAQAHVCECGANTPWEEKGFSFHRWVEDTNMTVPGAPKCYSRLPHT